jgi:hypothetical protein
MDRTHYGILAFCLLAISSSASAQTAPQSSPLDQALSAKLMAEMNYGLQCATDLISVKAELDKAKQKIKELEGKEAPKPDGPH